MGPCFVAVAATLACGGAAPYTGAVRVIGHGLTDDKGPFLGLGVSYFTALRRFRNDLPRLERDLAFLSRQGFVYTRVFTMVGWYPAWDGLEIAPVSFTSRSGKRVDGWPDYWRCLSGLVDLAYDRYGMRTQLTIFADAQLMPRKEDRIEHMRRLLAEVVSGREHKIILLEVANEAWQNGFPGEQGTADLREFARYLADRTDVPVAITSNHEGSFESLYRDSAADIATWHFSRDRCVDGGWGPVTDCRRLASIRGCPPVSSNEPIGPGSSVASETDPAKLVLAAAFAFASRLPMYVFHSEAGVFGRSRFEDTPGVTSFRQLKRVLPADLPNWRSGDATDQSSPVRTDGCVRLVWCRKGDRLVCVAVGLEPNGMTLGARMELELRVTDPVTCKTLGQFRLEAGDAIRLPGGPGGLILSGTLRDAPGL
jgi:hypothetical protein